MRRIRPATLIVLTLAACGPKVAPTPTPGPAAGATRELLDVAYPAPAGGDAAMTTLDITWRDDRTPKRPVLLVHGGSWVGGDKRHFRENAPQLLEWFLDQGYTVFAPNFRLASPPASGEGFKPRDQAEDLAHAMRWVDDHGAEYGVTDSRPVLFGFSSGAHLVALLGADERTSTEVGLPADHVAATVSMDVHAYDVPTALELMVGSVVAHNIPFIEHLFGATEAEQLEGSPIHHLDGHVADALLVGAEPDPAVAGTHGWLVSEASSRYVDALTQSGNFGRFEHFAEKTHSGLVTGFGIDGDGPTAVVGEFLRARGL